MYHRAPWVEFPIRRNPVFRAARTSLLPRQWCLESRRRGSHAPPREGGVVETAGLLNGVAGPNPGPHFLDVQSGVRVVRR